MKTRVLLTCLAFFFFKNVVQSQTLPPDFTLLTIGSSWVAPIGCSFSTDGQKLFVWEKSGKVYVCMRNAGGQYDKQATPVLDISEEVGNWRDYGLVGFTPDPNFNSNGFIYLAYVVDRHHLINFGTAAYNSTTNEYFSATIGRVTRYTTSTVGSNLIASPSSRNILLGETKSTGIPILHESHGIGGLAFAADGTLLVAGGDGASYNQTDTGSLTETYFVQALADGIIRSAEDVGAFRSQMVNSLSGKLLRINPSNGNGLPSNPFYDPAQPRAPKSRVWTLGLRNPFRFSVKPGTGSTNPAAGDIGEIYVGDVGWGLWEEFSIITQPGQNCGWPIYEGHTPRQDHFIWDSYSRKTKIKNLDEPNPLFGIGGCTEQYFSFTELLKQATADFNKTVYNPCNPSVPIGTGNRYFHHRPSIDWLHGGGSVTARVGTFSNNDAYQETIGTPASGVTGSPFNGSASVGGLFYNGTLFPEQYRNSYLNADYVNGWIKRFKIDFTTVIKQVSDLATGFNAPVCMAQNPLTGTVVVVELGTNSVKEIGYGGNYQPTAKIIANTPAYGPSALNVSFTGTGSFDPDGAIVSYLWNFGDGSPTSTLNTLGHIFTAPLNVPTKYLVKLTVTDNLGGVSTDSMIISVNNTPPVVNITSPIKNSIYRIGSDTLYLCEATVTDAEHSPAQLRYEWQTFLRHNSHQHSEKIEESVSPQTRINRIGCNGDNYYWMIKLTVTDQAGLSTSDSSKIYPSCQSIVLPVILRSFSVTHEETENMVKWTTELEDNIDYYQVERCQDGINFLSIYNETARNIRTATTYSYRDQSFLPGINYYRLKIIEKSGTVRYSVIIKISALKNSSNKILIAPNPVSDVFSLSYNNTQRKGTVLIQIWDINGRILQTYRQIVNEGNNVIYLQTMQTWPSGSYYISLKNGNEILRSKFIIAK